MPQLTIFIPLSGRHKCWERLSVALSSLHVSRERCRLYLLDTSQDPEFTHKVLDWVKTSSFKNFAVDVQTLPTTQNLANLRRDVHFAEVNNTMVRIYSLAKRVTKGEFTLIIEDDVIPPADVFTRLQRHLHHDIFSISAAYPVRGFPRWNVWRNLKEPPVDTVGEGVERVAGTGFGCLLMRTHDFQETPLGWVPRDTNDPRWPWGYDMEFFRKVQVDRPWQGCLVDWDTTCEHLAEH